VVAGECGSNCFTGQIETVLPSGQKRRVVVADVASHQPRFSPDGRSIAYSTSDATGQRKLARVRADGSGRPRWLDTAEFPSSPAWDATGHRLVYFSSYAAGSTSGKSSLSPSGEPYLYIYDGNHSKRLTSGRYPAWSSTNRIAFFRHDGLYLIRTDGTGLKRLSTHPALYSGGQLAAQHLDWSPDGRWLVFGGLVEGVGGTVLRIRADGSGLQRLATGQAPSFSPDGKSIVFRGVEGLMVMGANGSQPRKIARVNAVATDWQPLPSRPDAEPAAGRSGAQKGAPRSQRGQRRAAYSAPEGASRSASKEGSGSSTLAAVMAIAALSVLAAFAAAMRRKRGVRSNRNETAIKPPAS
jgi:Tol biopolymer transport system component